MRLLLMAYNRQSTARILYIGHIYIVALAIEARRNRQTPIGHPRLSRRTPRLISHWVVYKGVIWPGHPHVQAQFSHGQQADHISHYKVRTLRTLLGPNALSQPCPALWLILLYSRAEGAQRAALPGM